MEEKTIERIPRDPRDDLRVGMVIEKEVLDLYERAAKAVAGVSLVVEAKPGQVFTVGDRTMKVTDDNHVGITLRPLNPGQSLAETGFWKKLEILKNKK